MAEFADRIIADKVTIVKNENAPNNCGRNTSRKQMMWRLKTYLFPGGGDGAPGLHRSFKPLNYFLLRSVSFIFVGTTTASQVANFDKCCVNAARAQLKNFPDQLPWRVCRYGSQVNWENNEAYPSVTRTMGWCLEKCGGYQFSKLDQWVGLLATWIAPYFGLLLLCPVGEQQVGNHDHTSWLLKGWHKIRFPGDEYVNLLGDPAGAIWGALWESYIDSKLVRKLSKSSADSVDQRTNNAVIGLFILVGNTRLDPGAQRQSASEKIRSLPSTDTSSQPVTEGIQSTTAVSVGGVSTPATLHQPTNIDTNPKNYVKEITQAIEVVLKARTPFHTAIAIPAVLMLAVTATSFRDAYTMLGDNDKAHSLAYGVWFSWLVFLAVLGNCFATSVNVGLANTALDIDMTFNPVLSLRKLYSNSAKWQRLLEEWESRDTTGTDSKLGEKYDTIDDDDDDGTIYDFKFYAIYLVGVTFAWMCIGFSSACATVISYTTPTVGIGCRSLNFILYATLSLFIAWLSVLRHWLCHRSWKKPSTANATTNLPPASHRGYFLVATLTYRLLALINTCIMIVGTTLHVVGIYRTCRCNKLLASPDFLIEMSKNTKLGIDNALKFWFSTGAVAFSLVWILCGLAVLMRTHLMLKLDASFLGVESGLANVDRTKSRVLSSSIV
ncbi:hypothetical protein MMC31_005956 [Peltigera leucophlebia]|nr:hypothetical protein [Peltigera leucophlebia]